MSHSGDTFPQSSPPFSSTPNQRRAMRQLWKDFITLSQTHPGVFKSIVERTAVGDRESLRLADNDMRVAVNSLVTTVSLPSKATEHANFSSDITCDLGLVFPNASKLRICVATAATPIVAVIWLDEQLMRTSPKLLANTKGVDLFVSEAVIAHATVNRKLLAVLLRCTKLESFSLFLPTPALTSYHFEGHGTTPADRIASLHCQLTSIVPPHHLLYPLSHSSYSALTSVHLAFRPSQSLLSANLATILSCPSLQNLTLRSFPLNAAFWTNAHTHLPLMTALTALTKLDAPAFGGDGNEVVEWWEAVGKLPNLQHLRVNRKVAWEEREFVIPGSWANLTALTWLTVNSPCIVDLAALHRLTSLKYLDVVRGKGSINALNGLRQLEILRLHGSTSEALGVEDLEAAGLVGCDCSKAAGSTPTSGAARWDVQLKDVRWEGADAASLAQLSKLTSMTNLNALFHNMQPAAQLEVPDMLVALKQLRCLDLGGVAVGPELCWALGNLTRLTLLGLSQAIVPNSTLNLPRPKDTQLIPKLHCLRLLAISGSDADNALALLMKWTRIDQSTDLKVTGVAYVEVGLVSTNTTCLGWIRALGNSRMRINMLMVLSNRDADDLCKVVGAMRDVPLQLLLVSDVSQSSLARLLASWGGKELSLGRAGLDISAMCYQEPALRNKVFLPSNDHIKAVAAACPQLTHLNLFDSQLVEDSAMIRIAQFCRKLQSLLLVSPALLTDTALWALSRYCSHLTSLELESATKLTLRGVQPWFLSGGDKTLHVTSPCGFRPEDVNDENLVPPGHFVQFVDIDDSVSVSLYIYAPKEFLQ